MAICTICKEEVEQLYNCPAPTRKNVCGICFYRIQAPIRVWIAEDYDRYLKTLEKEE